LKKTAWLLPLTILGSAALMIGVICAGYLIINVNQTLPDVESIRSVELKVPLRVYSADGLLISEFGNERRKRVDLEETPQALQDAVLASEDDRFYAHSGIDFSGLIRAALANFRTGASQQGASTITMQVARNFFLSREKTYIRKLREVLLAFKLEQILSKEEILHLYLNKIFLGHRAYGFGAAAEVYYGRELSELTLAELAMLAGLPKAPSSNNPLRNPERARLRRNYVLGRMLELGKISSADYQIASQAPITASKQIRVNELAAPHIAEMVRAELIENLGESAYWAGLNVHTTIFAAPQRSADKALRAGLQDYDRRHGFRGPISRFDLSEEEDPALDEAAQQQSYANLLAALPNSHEQVPALVLEARQDDATLQTYDHGQVTLLLEDSRWARRHLTANSMGERPTAMNDLLTRGDVVYIAPKEESGKDKVENKPADAKPAALPIQWKLSQIPNVSGALISIEPNSGRILSLVGGYDFFLNKYNRAIQSIRQPGSNIKPFIYSAALDAGFTPATLISGAPIVMTDPTHGTVWRPENYSGKFYGPTRMREALAKSMNLVSIRLLRSIGIPYTRDYLARFGINMERFSPTLTMALGSGGITPLELLSAYAVLANGGYRIQPYFIDHVTDRDGNIVYQAPTPEFCDACYAQYLPEPEIPDVEEEETPLAEEAADELDLAEEEPEEIPQQAIIEDVSQPRTYTAPRVMNHANNFFINSMLKDVVRRGTARKALVLEREDLAGKTGTTNEYVDAWFTGFNDQIATTVWIGFDDPKSMGRGEAGSKAALPIWIDYMRVALNNIQATQAELPDFIEEGWVNRNTGKRTDELDPDAIAEYFPITERLPEPFGELGLSEYQRKLLMDATQLPEGEDAELGPLDEFGDSLELIEEEMEPLPIEQKDRIIEEDEDTRGLF
jgi:penicillin-binding protein 1A